jgi:hypothetical protein
MDGSLEELERLRGGRERVKGYHTAHQREVVALFREMPGASAAEIDAEAKRRCASLAPSEDDLYAYIRYEKLRELVQARMQVSQAAAALQELSVGGAPRSTGNPALDRMRSTP